MNGGGPENCGSPGRRLRAVRKFRQSYQLTLSTGNRRVSSPLARFSFRPSKSLGLNPITAAHSACHSPAGHNKTCSVAKENCASCHMPKIELPGAHARFTDHQIRIARAKDAYPN